MLKEQRLMRCLITTLVILSHTAVVVVLGGCSDDSSGRGTTSELDTVSSDSAGTVNDAQRSRPDGGTPDDVAVNEDDIQNPPVADTETGLEDSASTDVSGLDTDEPLPSGDAGPADTAMGNSDTESVGDTSVTPAGDPGSPGGYSYNQQTESIVLSQGMFGDESLQVDVLIPDGTNRPVVLFLPGAQLLATDYTSTREHLASMGFVVVFPGFFDGSLLDLPDAHAKMKEDVIAVIDWIESQANGAWSGVVDASRIAAVGHSLGGKLSFLAATEDARIDAIAGIDPVDSGPPPLIPTNPADYPSVAPELMDLIDVPMLIMGETVNAVASFQACAPAEDNFQQYYAAATAPAMQIDFIGANHMSFLDDPTGCPACAFCPSGTDDPATTRQTLRRLLTAFLAVHLNSDNSWTGWLIGDEHNDLVQTGLITSEFKNGFDSTL